MKPYLEELRRELTAHGIRGRLRARILAELADHLAADPHAELGPAGELANEFAATIGAEETRRAAFRSFAALGVAGAAYATCFLSLASAHQPPSVASRPLAALAFAVIVLAPQASFVAGSLAALRAFRRRDARALPTRELAIINRRTHVALACGLMTMGALALYAFELHTTLPASLPAVTYAVTASASILLVGASVRGIRAATLRPVVEGDGGDLFDDLGSARIRMDPWRFAVLVATALGTFVWLAGIAQSDPIDGLLRGVLEGLACFAGFAALGKFLGLRR